MTEGVGRLIEAVDNERLAIAAALGVSVLSEPEIGIKQGYMTEDNYSTGYSTAPGFLGIGAQSQLDHRYLTEDVGYALVFLTDLAARLGVPTPVIDAVITITSVVLARDFRGEGMRTVATLGLTASPARTSPRSDPCRSSSAHTSGASEASSPTSATSSATKAIGTTSRAPS